MKIKVNLKSLPGKRAKIIQKEIDVPVDNVTVSLHDLLMLILSNEVAEHNTRVSQNSTKNYLTENEIIWQAFSGFIGFGEIYNTKTVDRDNAFKVALQAFEDGLFAIFINDQPMEDLSVSIDCRDIQHLTFIKLTFLSGSIW